MSTARRHQTLGNRATRAAALTVVLATGLGLGLVASAPAGAADRRGPSVSSGSGVLALDWGDLDKTPRAGRGDVVIMQSWEYPRIPQLRQDNPGVTILMYKDVSATVKEAESATGRFPSGVGYDDVAATHPEWFLRDRTGTIVEWSDWSGLYPMDIANRSYQATWSSNVLAELRQHDWDGVMMDDVLTWRSHSTFGDRVPTALPDDAAQYAATTSFLSRVGPRIKAAGYLAVPNVSVEWDNWRTTMADWTRYVSGWENEHFTNWQGDSARFSGADWQWKHDLAVWLADRDVPLYAVTYGSASDTVAQTFHRASWLLTWNGRTGASIFVPSELDASHWQPAATRSVGRPLGAARQLPNGTWIRRFSAGIVTVNPTTAPQTTNLGGTYRRGARRVARIQLAPSTAAILLR